jgi:hypothetical protein
MTSLVLEDLILESLTSSVNAPLFVLVVSVFKTNVLVCSRPRFDSRFL